MNKLCLLVACLACPIVACGDDATSSGPIPASQLYETLAQTYCDVLRGCSFDSEDAALISLFAKATSASTCASYISRTFTGLDFDVEAEVAAGHIIYDADKFSACMKAARTRCTLDSLVECRDVFHGTVAIDGACQHTEQCVEGAWCDATSSCGGTCKARVAVGESCTSSNACLTTSGPTECAFETGKCVAIVFDSNVAVGAQCGEFLDGTTEHKASCGKGLICTFDDASQKDVCVAPIAVGASCAADDAGPCAPGTLCVPTSETEAACTAIPVKTTEGVDCNTETQTGPPVACSIFDRLTCFEGKCKRLGDGTAGSFCQRDLELAPTCNPGLFCADDDKCTALKDEGADCQDGSECKSDSCDAQNKCAPETVCQ
ncbi:MAG: hypothetical protein U1F43_07825 [Myxococcota bacterium]